MKRIAQAAALGITLLLPAAAAPAQRDVPYTYQGTVHAVKANDHTLDIITGVGYALRIVHMRALPTTLITSDGAAVGLAEVAPGDVVRADCRRTDAGLVVDKIEIKRRGT